MKGSVKAKYRKPQFSMQAIKEKWNPELSARKNLANMGLAADPNQDFDRVLRSSASAQASAASSKQINACELFDIPESDTLRGCDVNLKRRAKPMSEMDQKYIAPLLEVHGEDFVAMFRDMKRNPKQLTEPRLQKLAARYKLLDEKDVVAKIK